MLALDRQYGPFAGLAVFGDHADPSLFYVVPDSPRWAAFEEGTPEVSLLKYKRDLEGGAAIDGSDIGGGFFAFTTELLATEEQRQLAISELSKLGIDSPRLVGIPFRGGKAALATVLGSDAPEGGLRFFERVLGETTPSLYGSERATFSLVMPTHEDVTLVEGMLSGTGTTPIGVVYTLEYDGIRPAAQAKITAKYDRAYHQLKQQFSAGASYYGIGLSVDLGWAIQQLRERGDLEVEIFEFTDDEDLRHRTDDALQWFQQQLVQDFFRPSMAPPGSQQDILNAILQAAKAIGIATASALLANSGAMRSIGQQLGLSPGTMQGVLGGNASGASQFTLRISYTFLDLTMTEDRTRVIDYRLAAAERRTAAPQGLLPAFPPEQLVSLVREVNLASDEFRNLKVRFRPVPDFAEQGVSKLTVELEYPADRAPDAPATSSIAFTFDAGQPITPQLFAAWIDDAGHAAYRYRVTLAFASDSPWRGADPVYTSDWIPSLARELVISPLSHMRALDLAIGPGLLDWKEVTEVQLDLRAGGEAGVTQTVLMTQSAPNARARFRLPKQGDTLIEARSTWFLEGAVRITGDWVKVDSTTLLVDGPFTATRVLRLIPMLPPAYTDCSVTVDYTERGYHHSEIVTFTPGDNHAQMVNVRTFTDGPVPLDLRVYLTRADLSTFDSTLKGVTVPAFVVTDHGGFVRRIEVHLLSSGRFFDLKLSAVKVELLDIDDEEKVTESLVFTESKKDPVTWFISAKTADEPLKYKYRVARYDLNGQATKSASITSEDEILLVPAVVAPG